MDIILRTDEEKTVLLRLMMGRLWSGKPPASMSRDEWTFLKALKIEGTVEEIVPVAPPHLRVVIGGRTFIGNVDRDSDTLKIYEAKDGVIQTTPFMLIPRGNLKELGE